MNLFYQTAWLIVFPFFKLLFRTKYIGRENLPKNKGFIICSNHISLADPFFIGFGFRTPLYFIAKEELFKNFLVRWFLHHINVFPIKRGIADTSALNFGATLIKEGKILGMFPEGTRSMDGKPHRAKSGIALIASLAEADIVPAAIISRGKVRPFKKVIVIYGKIIPYADLKITGEGHGELHKVSALIMEHITRIWEDG